MGKTVTINFLVRGDFRHWDTIGSSRWGGIIINRPKIISGHSSIKVYPYKERRTKFWRFVYFNWIRILVILKIIK